MRETGNSIRFDVQERRHGEAHDGGASTMPGHQLNESGDGV